jgi:hypothetical protein
MKYHEVIRAAHLHGFGGFCGVVALAINEAIFDSKGTLVVATNPHVSRLWRHSFLGHVGVRYRGRIYDAEGVKDYEDFRAWGMVDPQDPEYTSNPDDPDDPDTVWLTDEQATDDAEVIPLSDLGDPIEVISEFTAYLAEMGAAWGDDIGACPTYKEAVRKLRAARRRFT